MKTHHFIQKLTPLATALLLALSSYSALAEKKDDHEMEHHDSHEHGVARLTVATTDDGLEIALESPAANVFGFEHSAKSEEEREAVHAAMDKLKDGSALFAINSAAACSLEKATIEASAADDHEEKEDKHDDHEHEKKEDKHDDHEHEKEEDKHDDHEHEKKEDKHDEHDHSDKESHSDVDAVWAFHCDKPANIETVNVKIFSAFPGGFEEIAVEWITAADAGKTDLKEDGEISLKP